MLIYLLGSNPIKLNAYSWMKNKVLTREEGENLLRETFLPAYKDVLEAERKGLDFPDAHDLLTMQND